MQKCGILMNNNKKKLHLQVKTNYDEHPHSPQPCDSGSPRTTGRG
jgi:hypothetical protein